MASPLDYINAGFSGISSLGSLFTANSDQKAAIRLQKQLLQAQQKFAHDEAALNRDFQKQMWNASNVYNDPSAQVSRLSAAGLNPALAYGGSMATASPTSGSAASAPGAPQVDMLSGKSLMAAQIANLGAQTQNIIAQTKKTKAETDSQLTYNNFQQSILQNEINLGSVNARLGLANIRLTDAQTRVAFREYEKVHSEMEVLEAQRDELRASGMEIDSRRFLNEIDRVWRDRLNDAQFQTLMNQLGVSRDQARAALISASAALVGADASMMMSKAFGKSVDWQKDLENNPLNKLFSVQGDTLRLDYDVFTDKDKSSFRYWQLVNECAAQYVYSIGNVAGAFIGARTPKSAPSPVSVRGFGR
ncbi:DNA pilot protein [Dipodfec virus UOA04_Rod_495]|nr:DNA pilot protein [Dipodfec virus UOA04_Rod_495]